MELVFAIGLGLAAAGVALLLLAGAATGVKGVIGPSQKILSGYEPNWKREDKMAVLFGLAGGLMLAGFFRHTRYTFLLFFLGLAAGALLAKAVHSLYQSSLEQEKKRQVAIFFEAVELYMRGGKSMPKAIGTAQKLTPLLRKAVQKCLHYWPKSPARALEEFRKEVDVPEAQILVSLLLRIEKSGINGMEGVIQRDAHNIERLRDMAARRTIFKRPMYFMMYRLLPTLTVLGMLIGSLYYRLGMVLDQVGIKF